MRCIRYGYPRRIWIWIQLCVMKRAANIKLSDARVERSLAERLLGE